MHRTAMQQAARIWLAAMPAIGTDDRVKKMRNAHFLKPLARRALAVICQYGQFETRIRQLCQRCQKIPLCHRIATPQFADYFFDLAAVGFIFL
ncbi:MAG: Uncharacterised protein [SAR116 cluster bacterium]|nr:MAG: Uncharacterised protein [SAR116 cluster bacterium]